MNYEGNFSEQDIRLIYEGHRMTIPDIKVIARYKTQKGYMALVFLYEGYCLFFVRDDYLQFQEMKTVGCFNEQNALEVADDIASSIGAEKTA